jgi:hypothetical protein
MYSCQENKNKTITISFYSDIAKRGLKSPLSYFHYDCILVTERKRMDLNHRADHKENYMYRFQHLHYQQRTF